MNKTDKKLIAVVVTVIVIMVLFVHLDAFAEVVRIGVKPPEYEAMEYIGDYWCSAYCECKKCCGSNAKGITASGLPVKSGYCAVDNRYIPLGTTIYVEGVGRLYACDTGVSGHIIDIYDENGHQHALHWNDDLAGKHRVYIITEVYE